MSQKTSLNKATVVISLAGSVLLTPVIANAQAFPPDSFFIFFNATDDSAVTFNDNLSAGRVTSPAGCGASNVCTFILTPPPVPYKKLVLYPTTYISEPNDPTLSVDELIQNVPFFSFDIAITYTADAGSLESGIFGATAPTYYGSGLVQAGPVISWQTSSGVILEDDQIYFQVDTDAAAVLEPSTWAMMLLGFGGLSLAGYRKAKNERTGGLLKGPAL